MIEAAHDGRLDVARVIEETPDEIRGAVAGVLLSSSFAECEDPERALRDTLAGLRGRGLARRAAELREESRRAAEAGDRDRARELALRAVELDRQRREAESESDADRSAAAGPGTPSHLDAP
jgi:hypothetical protein